MYKNQRVENYEHKNILKIENLHFLPNKILTRLFKELKRKKEKKRMTINNT